MAKQAGIRHAEFQAVRCQAAGLHERFQTVGDAARVAPALFVLENDAGIRRKQIDVGDAAAQGRYGLMGQAAVQHNDFPGPRIVAVKPCGEHDPGQRFADDAVGDGRITFLIKDRVILVDRPVDERLSRKRSHDVDVVEIGLLVVVAVADNVGVDLGEPGISHRLAHEEILSHGRGQNPAVSRRHGLDIVFVKPRQADIFVDSKRVPAEERRVARVAFHDQAADGLKDLV